MLLTHYYQHHKLTNAHPLPPTPQTGAEKATNVAHPLPPTPQTGAEISY